MATFLEKIGLEKYGRRLESQGFNTALDLCLIDEDDLNSISITDQEDRAKIIQGGRKADIFLQLNIFTLCLYY